MAAYAALVSLMNTLDNVQHHRRFSNSLDKKQVETLREKLNFLLEFIENTTTHDSQSDEARLVLESQIASAAFAAEDVIESHIHAATAPFSAEEVIELGFLLEFIENTTTHSESEEAQLVLEREIASAAGSIISLLDLETVIQDMDSVKEKVASTAKEQRGFKDHVQLQPTHPTSSSTWSTPLMTVKSKMVGLDDKLIQLLDELTGHEAALKIVPITGMGGIGKTTLARNAYEKQLIVQHFDFRAWVTVSQQYTVRDIFSKLLSCQSGEADEHELGECLHKSLIGRRYLIILDDIWSLEAWHSIKRFFPNNNNRSRVVVTTRLSTIANHLSTSALRLGFLDEDKSWELFCETAFPGEVCPHELEEIGKKIVKKCKGLPLLIVVIGALLRKSPSLEYWEYISENIRSVLSSGEEESLDILSLSYNHLPAHLKPCFLYMGTVAEDEEITGCQLINLWVAEGFIKPSETQSLEEVAEDYLKDLVDRNLILSVKETNIWNFVERELCSIHDLLRDLCLKKAEKENLLCVMRVGDIRQGIDTGSCFVFNRGRVLKPIHSYTVEFAFLARSLASNGDSKFKMLRVLNAPRSTYSEDHILKQANLRYMAFAKYIPKDPFYLYSSISRLWNLQTLAISFTEVVAPREIWEMPSLRHVHITTRLRLPDPPLLQGDDESVVMQNLQTLWRVINLSAEVCKGIPNVKTLWVLYSVKGSIAPCVDFGSLYKLESLDCQFHFRPRRVDLLQNLTFPSSLHKLYLRYSYLHWEDLTMIGSLPHLRALRLGEKSVIGSEWNPVEGEFLSLRLLELVKCDDLINWNADNSHFPLLEKLLLRYLPNLNEIPSNLGEIPTLAEITLYGCRDSLNISAVRILDQQESFGNEGLRVLIHLLNREEAERFKEKIEQLESSTSNNLLIYY